MIILAQGSVLSTNGNTFNRIRSEFNEVINVERVSHLRRRNLLRVLHSTRALDTSLRSFLDHYRIRGRATGLGGYLRQLLNVSVGTGLSNLNQAEVNQYVRLIANVRNMYMHEADRYPRNDREILDLLREMEACLTRVLNL